MPTLASKVSNTGSWNAMPNAKISFITKSRYSPTLACNSIGQATGAIGRLERQEEAPCDREDEVVRERRTGHEQHRRGDQERQEGALLAAVQTGRHEHVELRRYHREAEERATEERHLDVGEERLIQRRVDQPPVLPVRDCRMSASGLARNE